MSFKAPAWARPSDIVDLLRLSVPIAISRMSVMLMSVTDAVVLGQFAPGQLPYVLNSWLPIGVSIGLGLGLLLGTQVLTAELGGVLRENESGRIFRRGLWFAIALGAVLTLIIYLGAEALFRWLFIDMAPDMDGLSDADPVVVAERTSSVTRIISLGLIGFMLSSLCSYYLEALRRPLLVTCVMYFGVVVNLIIDLALVAGWWGIAPMGAEGVAWATTGSRWALTLVMLLLCAVLTPAFRASPQGPVNEWKRQLSVGVGTAISNVAEWGGFNATFIIATWISLVANTVYGYTFQIIGVAFMFYLGIATATSVRVAEAYGRGNADEVRDAGRLGVAATLLTGLSMGCLFMLFGDGLARLLVKGDAVMDGVHLATAITSMLLLAAFVTVFDGLQAIASFAMRAQEIVWLPSLVHIASFFVLMIPACYWFGITQGYGAKGMMMGAALSCAVAGISQWILLEVLPRRAKRATGPESHVG